MKYLQIPLSSKLDKNFPMIAEVMFVYEQFYPLNYEILLLFSPILMYSLFILTRVGF